MSELPRVLLCAFDVVPAPTGTSRRITEYLKALNGRFSVVAMTAKTPDVSHIERYQGARLLRVPVGAGDLVSRIQAFERAVRRQLESEEFSLAHFFDPFAGYTLAELRGDYGYRLLYDAHAFPSADLRYTQPQLDGDRRFLAKVRRQELFCLLNSDAVVVSSQVAAEHVQALGVAPERIRQLRAPADVQHYVSRAASEPDGQPMRVIYVGSQVGWQGLPTLLRAMRPIAAKDAARLTILGPRHPDWQPRLEDLVDDLALAGKVELHPPVPHDELPRILSGSDLAVAPLEDVDRNRGHGGALSKASEYLAAGRPIVASDLPVTRELLPESCTRFFPPGDVAALSETLRGLAEDPRLRVELGRKARAEAQRLVDSAQIRAQLLSLYADLLGQAGRAAVAMEPAEGEAPGDLTATPTSKVFAALSRREGPTPISQREGPTPVSHLPRAARNAAAYEGAQTSSGVRTAPGSPASADEPSVPTAEMVPQDSLSSDGTDPAARARGADFTPRPAAAPEPPPDRQEPSDSSITSPGTPIPVDPLAGSPDPSFSSATPESGLLPPPAAPSPPAPSVVVAPGVLAEASRLGAAPAPPTAPLDLTEGLPGHASPAASSLAAAPPPAPGPAPALDSVERSAFLGGTSPALLNTPTQPRLAMASHAPSRPQDEPEEISSSEIMEEAEPDAAPSASGAQSGLPDSLLDPWLSQVVHGYCPPEGIQFARPTPPTTMPGRDPRPTPLPKAPLRPK